MRTPKSPNTEPLLSFIADLAGKLVKSYGLDPEEAQAEAKRVEAECREEIAEAMRLGYGVIVFIAASYRLEATFDKHGMTRLRRLDLVLR
jgi:hypothetical protein